MKSLLRNLTLIWCGVGVVLFFAVSHLAGLLVVFVAWVLSIVYWDRYGHR